MLSRKVLLTRFCSWRSCCCLYVRLRELQAIEVRIDSPDLVEDEGHVECWWLVSPHGLSESWKQIVVMLEDALLVWFVLSLGKSDVDLEDLGAHQSFQLIGSDRFTRRFIEIMASIV